MQRLFSWIKSEYPTLTVIVLGALVQLWLITRPISFMVQSIFPDDAFFYFQIARNIVGGFGSTLDGINLTNGYHPLWMLILLPVFKYVSSPFPDLAPVRIALLIQVLLIFGTSLFVARIFARFTDSRWISAFGMIVFLLNPFFLYGSVNGLETPLMLFFLSFFFLLALRIEEGTSDRYWLIGIVGGLLVLSRIDAVLYVGAFLGWTFVCGDWKDSLKKALMVAVPAAVVISPWIVWNYLNFHMLLTSASDASTLANHAIIVQDHGPSFGQFLKAIIYTSQYHLDAFFQRTGMYALGAAFFGALIALVLQGVVQVPKRWREIPVSIALFIGFVGIFIANASIRWSAREWYFIAFDIFFSIAVVIVTRELFKRVNYPRLVACALLGAVLFSFYVDWSKQIAPGKNQYDAQGAMLGAAQWMEANLPSGTSIGTYSPGFMSYFDPNLHIIDLDGLANNSVYDAMKTHAVWRYIEANTQYLCLYDSDLTYSYNAFLGEDDPLSHLTPLVTLPGPYGFKVYKVN